MTDLLPWAARVVLDLVTSDDAKHLASESLKSGEYSPAAVELESLQSPRKEEVQSILETWLREHGISFPAKEDATWILLRHHMRRLAQASTEAEARNELGDILDVFNASNLHERSAEYAGDSHDVARIYGIIWELNDLPDSFRVSGDSAGEAVATAELIHEAKGEADRWCRAHSA
jgi:hypothetical protein